jgi:hypothetical protein
VTRETLGDPAARPWTQLPTITSASRWETTSPVARAAIAIVLVTLAPTGRTLALAGAGWASVVAAGGCLAALAISRTPSSWPPTVLRAAGTLGGVAVVTLAGGRVAGAWTLLGALGAAGVTSAWHQHPARGAFRAMGPVLGATVGAAVAAVLEPRAVITSVLVLTAAVLGVAAARWYDRMVAADAAARRGSERVGDALAVLVFAILAIPFVALPWIIGRVVRWDPTWSPTRPGSTWTPTFADAVPSTRTWQPAPPKQTWPWTRRATRTGLRLALIVLVLAFALQTVRQRASEPDASLLAAPAMAGADYWPELIRAQDQLRTSMGLGSYAYEQPDVASRYLNIEDGHRVSWSPPSYPSCRAASVWVFGGSTTFGEGQRDEHTVPSALARAAWADGVALDVTNFGQLGDPHWIEVRRLEEALGTSPDRPDLIIFYDGANEVITRVALNDQGQAARQTFVSYLDSGLFLQLDRYLRPLYGIASDADALEVQPTVEGRLGAAEVAALAARQYRLSLASSQRLVADEGIPTIWFNQPTTWSTLDRKTAAEWGDATAFGRAVTAEYLQDLPEGVVDLSGLFRDTDEPIFYDTAHTNELGAERVATAMWDEVEGQLSADCGSGDGCC